MKKFLLVFALNFMYWSVYFLLIVMFILLVRDASDPKYMTELREKDLIRSVVLMFFCPAVLSYMLNYFYIIRFLKSKKYLKFGLYFILSLLIISFLTAFIIYYTSPFKRYYYFVDIFGILFLLAISTFHGSMGLIIKGFVLWFEEMKLKKELQEKNHQMELALVKSQLDPHFLFNTLNNIDVLILKDAEKASLFLNKLSDIMRFMLFETKDEKIELAKEITYIEKYIELQKIRTSNPNYVTVSIDIEVDTVLISPMLFIPFIENAFKYAEPFKSENAIEIRIKATHNKLDFECDNKCSNHSNSISNNGLGNELIQKRLALLYPEHHHLEMTELNGVFKVKLSIDL